MGGEQIVTVLPHQLTIHHGPRMLVTNREGWVRRLRDGLFAYDTRYLSTYEIQIETLPLIFLTAEAAAYNCAILTYANPPFRAGLVSVEGLALLVRIYRFLDDRLRETVEVTSFAGAPISFRLMINLEPSFDTIFEVRELVRRPPRPIQMTWDGQARLLRATYRDTWFDRQLWYQIARSDSAPTYSPSLLIFRVSLRPGQSWRAEIETELSGEPLDLVPARSAEPARRAGPAPVPAASAWPTLPAYLRGVQAGLARWASQLTRIRVDNPVVQRAYDQAVRDLASLRFEPVAGEWYPAAGVPWYNAIFGRDALITAIQCLPLGCPFPRAVLTRLAELQGRRVDLWTDEEPGKIPHELRVDQLTLMGKLPFHPFYGSVDATLLYVILLSEAYRFSGDRGLLEQFVPTMDRCLRWAAEYGDVDGDDFIEYWMRSPRDYHNQAWKDAGDAVVYPDGRIVEAPIAIVEVQGYYYDALRRAAEIYRWLGRIEDARVAEARAERLSAHFQAAYWMPDEGFYAFGLDPAKQPIRSIASNPGQLLWSGIVPADRAPQVARRLLQDDLYSGWGVRTLSARNGGYDPISYQRGSVWPHDNALIALGLKQYGLWEAANQIAAGIFEASGHFARGSLPELWAGLDRAETVWPVPYPRANLPQAWAAGSVPMLLRAILGIQPAPVERCLIVDPTLPPWLPELTVIGLPFLDGTADFRVRGAGPETALEVLRVSGTFEVAPAAKVIGGSR